MSHKTGSPHVLNPSSLFNILYILIMSPFIHLLSGVVFSLLFRVLALSFLLILSESLLLITCNNIPGEDQQFKCTMIFCVFSSANCFNMFLPYLYVDQIFIPSLNSALRQASAFCHLSQLI